MSSNDAIKKTTETVMRRWSFAHFREVDSEGRVVRSYQAKWFRLTLDLVDVTIVGGETFLDPHSVPKGPHDYVEIFRPFLTPAIEEAEGTSKAEQDLRHDVINRHFSKAKQSETLRIEASFRADASFVFMQHDGRPPERLTELDGTGRLRIVAAEGHVDGEAYQLAELALAKEEGRELGLFLPTPAPEVLRFVERLRAHKGKVVAEVEVRAFSTNIRNLVFANGHDHAAVLRSIVLREAVGEAKPTSPTPSPAKPAEPQALGGPVMPTVWARQATRALWTIVALLALILFRI